MHRVIFSSFSFLPVILPSFIKCDFSPPVVVFFLSLSAYVFLFLFFFHHFFFSFVCWSEFRDTIRCEQNSYSLKHLPLLSHMESFTALLTAACPLTELYISKVFLRIHVIDLFLFKFKTIYYSNTFFSL